MNNDEESRHYWCGLSVLKHSTTKLAANLRIVWWNDRYIRRS
ncbi:hypothetical protein MHB77_11625 [Paenibacillus sp. FSL K6-3166]